MEKTFAELLSHWMEERGMGNTDLARAASEGQPDGFAISNSGISRIVKAFREGPNSKGAIVHPHPKTKARLIAALGLTNEEFYKDAPRFRSATPLVGTKPEPIDIEYALRNGATFGGIPLTEAERRALLSVVEVLGQSRRSG